MSPADFHIVAGAELHTAIEAEKETTVPHSKRPGLEQYYESEALCAFHCKLDRRGILGAELVKSIYGWSVRYDSGLQNFGIIAGSRCGTLDGTLADAERYAREWVAQDPTRRYVWVRVSALLERAA